MNLLEHNLYEVVSRMPYGNCFVSIYNTEGDEVAILVEDGKGTEAWWAIDRKEFSAFGATVEGLERLLNGILYYTHEEEWSHE